MDAVRGYVYSLMVVAFAAGAVDVFAADKTDGVSRLVRFTVALLVALAMLRPLYPLLELAGNLGSGIADGGEGIEQPEGDASKRRLASAQAELAEGELERMLAEECGVPTENISVKLMFDDSDIDNIKLVGASVGVSGCDEYTRAEIKESLEARLECSVSIE